MPDGPEMLPAMVGTWEGTYRLWLEPDVLQSEGSSQARVDPIVRDRLVLLRYDWPFADDRHEGTMVLAWPTDETFQVAWADSFHNGNGIMWCTGGPEPVVLGSYDAGGDRGEWRTAFAMPDADHLVVTAWNIWQGQEAKATEATYERVAG